jgi:hypothetical protein
MPLIKLNTRPTPRQLRQFAAVGLPAFAALIAWIAWRAGARPDVVAWALALVGAYCCAALALPELIRPAFVGLMVAAYPIGWIVSHLVLAILYFGVITPIGLVLRLARGDAMQRRWAPQASTYWQTRAKADDLERYFRQY